MPFGTGVITFGTAYDPDDLSIPQPRASFKTTTKKIAWSASLLTPAGATSLTLILAVSDPSFDVLANEADLALLLDRKAGTYVMRYLRGSDVLAEGQFALVK